MSDALVEKTVPLLLRGGEPVEVRIFQCARKWADLTETPDEGVRHCDSCNQRVHAISDVAGIKWAIAEARCVCVAGQSGAMFVGGLQAGYRLASTTLTWDGCPRPNRQTLAESQEHPFP